MNKLPYTNISEFISKKDAWLVWTTNDAEQINDFNIYDFSKENVDGQKTSVDYVEMQVGGHYFDWGACCSSWDHSNLADVFFKFGFQYQFSNILIKKDFLDALSLIREWRKDIIEYMGILGF